MMKGSLSWGGLEHLVENIGKIPSCQGRTSGWWPQVVGISVEGNRLIEHPPKAIGRKWHSEELLDWTDTNKLSKALPRPHSIWCMHSSLKSGYLTNVVLHISHSELHVHTPTVYYVVWHSYIQRVARTHAYKHVTYTSVTTRLHFKN